MIFNEGAVCFVLCSLIYVCSGLKGHTGDTQDQTSSRPNTLFDDADDIQRQLDNEARDRFKYGRPKAIWILNIPTQISLMTNTFDGVHRRPRNPVTSTAWRNKFHLKSKPSKKNNLEAKSEYFIEEPELMYKNNPEPEPNKNVFVVPESNNKNNIEPEQNFDYVTKQGSLDNNDIEPPSEITNSMKPDDGTDIIDSDYETGAEDINDLELPSDFQNYMDPGSDVGDDIKQGPDNSDYETGIDVENDLGPSLDVKNSMEPDVTAKQAPNNPLYATGADNNINPGSPLDVKKTVETGSSLKSDVNQVPDNLDSTSSQTSTQDVEDKSNLGQVQDVKTVKESGPEISDDLKQGSNSLDSTKGTDDNSDQGPSLDLTDAKKAGVDVNTDVKQAPDLSDTTTQSAEANSNLEPPVAKEAGPDVKQGSDNQGGDISVGSSPSWSYTEKLKEFCRCNKPDFVEHYTYNVRKEQDKWVADFPHCGLHSQSPVDLPAKGLVGARGARPLTFINYDVMPLQLRLQSDGNTVTLSGDWEAGRRPLIYGGAGHSRRYRFHSLTIHAPSEHSIGKFLFPLETQVLHVSTDYATFDDAVNGSSKDHLAFLGIVNIYKYGCKTEPALKQLLKVAAEVVPSSDEVRVDNAPLSALCPPFGEYACYHGSLTTPPCTEAVLWLVRGRALPLEREVASNIKMAAGNRILQPLNDRRVILFNKK